MDNEVLVGGVVAKADLKFWIELVAYIIVAIVPIVWAKVKISVAKKLKIEAQAFEVVEVAVGQVYDTFVRDVKAKADDGKLTKDEIADARGRAWDVAVGIAKEKGLDFAKVVTKQYFPILIDKAIKGLSKGE